MVIATSSSSSLDLLRPLAGFGGDEGAGAASCSGPSSGTSTASSFFARVFLALVVVAAFFPFAVFLDPLEVVVIEDAVVRTLSSTSAVTSASDVRSEAAVATDCNESRDALELLAAFDRPVFLGAGFELIRAKKGQFGARL